MHGPVTTAGRFTVPHHFPAIGQPQHRYSKPNPPARRCSFWFAWCFEVAIRVCYPRGLLRLRARCLGGPPRTIWIVKCQRQPPAGTVQYAVLHRACQIGKWAATSPTSGWPARAARWQASSWQLPAGKRRFFREDFSGSKSKKSLSTAATPRLRREENVIGTRSGSSAAGADRCWFEL